MDTIEQICKRIHPGWSSGIFQKCDLFLRKNHQIVLAEDALPEEKGDLFRALSYFPPEETRVVILGQDPYHTRGKANGLAFGIHPAFEGPRNSSILNISLELKRSTGQQLTDWTLESWAKQGVLLLNTRLSVKEGSPLSHDGIGWEDLVYSLLREVIQTTREKPVLWLVWGTQALKSVGPLLLPATHPALFTSHPCSFSASRGFLGCGHFTHELASKIIWGESPAPSILEVACQE